MNIQSPLIAVAVLLASAVQSAEVDIQFSGLLTSDGKTLVALTDTAKNSTRWVKLIPGATFLGYRIERYDANQDAVFVRKGDQEFRLRLVGGKVTDSASSAETWALAPATPADVRSNLLAVATASQIRSNIRKLVNAARQYQVQTGVSTVRYSEIVGEDKIIKALQPVAGEDYSTLTFGANISSISLIANNGMTLSYNVSPATGGVSTAGIDAPAANVFIRLPTDPLHAVPTSVGLPSVGQKSQPTGRLPSVGAAP